MLTTLGGLKAYFKLDSTVIDTVCFRGSCRATMALLFGCSVLITAKQFWGEPIKCTKLVKVAEDLVDTFCWTQSTYSVTAAWTKKVPDEVAYPGVDRLNITEERVYHKYYQWVCIVLFLQGLTFYFPRFWWKSMEKNRVARLTKSLEDPLLTLKNDSATNFDEIADYLVESSRTSSTLYSLCYIMSEFALWLNILLQIWLTDIFLGGKFYSYGWDVINFEWNQLSGDLISYNPMTYVFPNLAKCNFHLTGSGGTVESYNTLCLLPLNIFNEKIYLILWFWYWIIFTVMTGEILYRGAVVFSAAWRLFELRRIIKGPCPHLSIGQKSSYSKSSIKRPSPDDKESGQSLVSRKSTTDKALCEVVKSCSYNEWFLLSLMAKNMDPLNFETLIERIYQRISSNTDHSRQNGRPSNMASPGTQSPVSTDREDQR